MLHPRLYPRGLLYWGITLLSEDQYHYQYLLCRILHYMEKPSHTYNLLTDTCLQFAARPSDVISCRRPNLLLLVVLA